MCSIVCVVVFSVCASTRPTLGMTKKGISILFGCHTDLVVSYEYCSGKLFHSKLR